MAFTSVYFSLGSNLGNRQLNIEKALSMMDKGFGQHYEALSRIIESKAWGFSGDKFLNCAVLYRIFRQDLDAATDCLRIMGECKSIEKAMGRTDSLEVDEKGNRIYHSRIIDIDILFYGNEIIDIPELQVPHPLIKERDFVMMPLNEIAKPALKTAFPTFFGI
jgi:2-amino-4-hydroxy-6-hydroxymethyldihydropteridine diphosphokinase